MAHTCTCNLIHASLLLELFADAILCGALIPCLNAAITTKCKCFSGYNWCLPVFGSTRAGASLLDICPISIFSSQAPWVWAKTSYGLCLLWTPYTHTHTHAYTQSSKNWKGLVTIWPAKYNWDAGKMLRAMLENHLVRGIVFYRCGNTLDLGPWWWWVPPGLTN